MTFLKEKLTNRDQLAKNIRSNKYSYQHNLQLFDKIKASDYQWKFFYENMLLFGGALCLMLGLGAISYHLLTLVDFSTQVLLLLILVSVLVIIAFIRRRLLKASNVLLTLSLVMLGGIVYYIIQYINNLNLSTLMLCGYTLILLLLSSITRFKPIIYITILGIDTSIATIGYHYLHILDYVLAFCIVMFNALLLCSFLFQNIKDKVNKLYPDWYISLCLFTFNSFNIYYLYLVNSYLNSIWNVLCVMLNILLMLLYLYIFNRVRNFLNYTIVVMSCFLGAFITLFKFSTTLYSYVICTTLLIIVLNSFVKYLHNIQVRWRNLRN